tara:strand:- start:2973 stop:3098 length:126 start_codon:yes stop_codon:yes gene_type:complete
MLFIMFMLLLIVYAPYFVALLGEEAEKPFSVLPDFGTFDYG